MADETEVTATEDSPVEQLDFLAHVLAEHPEKVVLISTQLDDKDVTVVGFVYDNGDTFDVEPLAVLVANELFERLVRPDL